MGVRLFEGKRKAPFSRGFSEWWWDKDSNLGRHRQQIYSPYMVNGAAA